MADIQGALKNKWFWVGSVLGLGGVYYIYRKNKMNAASTTTTPTTDPSIDPTTGIPYADEAGYSSATQGTTPSLYSYLDPATGQLINAGVPSTSPLAPGTALAWVQQAVAFLSQAGYDPQTVLAALGKYINNVRPLTQGELDIINAARAAEGEPPGIQVAPITTVPPAGQLKTVYATGTAQLSQATSARLLIQSHSDPNAGPNAIESALRKTVADPRNFRYLPYYKSHGGMWPAKAKIYYVYIKSETTG